MGVIKYLLIISIFYNNNNAEQTYRDCGNDSLLECPKNSICKQFYDGLKCLCIDKFVLKSDLGSLDSYCVPIDKKKIVYIQPAANVKDLLMGITVVLIIAVVILGILFLIKLSRPIKRTRYAYFQLKRRRQNITELQEYDADDIVMDRLNTNM